MLSGAALVRGLIGSVDFARVLGGLAAGLGGWAVLAALAPLVVFNLAVLSVDRSVAVFLVLAAFRGVLFSDFIRTLAWRKRSERISDLYQLNTMAKQTGRAMEM